MTASTTDSKPQTVRSADGTSIAYERMGSGPDLVLVDGAFCGISFGPSRALATELASSFTVSYYDRRGRGSSTDTQPYSVQREVEDLEAVLGTTAGAAYVYGVSSGGALALEAAAAGAPIAKLLVYEAPYTGIGAGGAVDHEAHLLSLLAEDKRGAMVSYFLVRMVHAPAFVPLMLRLMPKVWAAQKAAAHTLPYETRVLNGFTVPAERLARITVPTRVLVGGKAAPAMVAAQEAVAAAVPGAEHAVLEGQTHQVSARAIAQQARDYFRASAPVAPEGAA
jgi:pimeloyl-ACP methyl ester carboxylesterase